MRKLLSSVAASLAPLKLAYVMDEASMRCALQIRDPLGGVLFQINEDDIFDAEGNRFENDLEFEP